MGIGSKSRRKKSKDSNDNVKESKGLVRMRVDEKTQETLADSTKRDSTEVR